MYSRHQVNLPAQAEINDAMGCIQTGINPNTVGDPTPATCLNTGPGSDQIVARQMRNQPWLNLLSFIPRAQPRNSGQYICQQRTGSE